MLHACEGRGSVIDGTRKSKESHAFQVIMSLKKLSLIIPLSA